jgi:hypothetical protein
MRVSRRALLRVRDEDGAAAALVALSLAAILGMLVLVVDLGGMLTLRRRMVGAADSAALATAQSCARDLPGEAATQADLLATANEPGAAQVSLLITGCGSSSTGSARVAYRAPIDLHFAPVLGLGTETTVAAKATAIWGPAGGTSPVPIEFAIDESGNIPCAFQPIGTQCNYWFDNSADHDLANSSNWGFMNLEAWGVSPDASCPNAGNSERRDWITGALKSNVAIRTIPTFVCVDSGHATSSWMDALISQIGKIKHFPITDPAQLIQTSGKEKYAVLGFAALKIVQVLKGNDPAAVGTQGPGGSCRDTVDLTTGGSVYLDGLSGPGCPGGESPDEISGLTLSSGQGNNAVVYREGVDYTYDEESHVVWWLGPSTPGVDVQFSWSTAGTPGACGFRDPDPNGVCLVASWQGAQVGGTNPGGGQDFGLRAIRLSE